MYFWNIKKLKKDIKNDKLTEGESFKYFFVNLLIISLFSLIPFNSTSPIFLSALSLLITVLGTYYLYKMNKGKKGKNFLDKYFALSWVFGIRFFVTILLPAVFSVIVILTILLGEAVESNLYLDTFLELIFIAYYWLLGRHMKNVS